MSKKIILCADDYAFSPPISKAIITLLASNRLSATSCMVNSPYWDEHAAWLEAFQNKADLGLHFTLTDVDPATGPRYQHPNIIKKAYLKKLKQTDIEKELVLQIEKFEKSMGRLPDFIDGHQHIHQLPIIRDALLNVYEKVFPNRDCYIRVPISKPRTLKASLITVTGATQLKKQLIKRKIPHNPSFSGVYHFSKSVNYKNHFQCFLKNIQSGGVIMCHPSLTTDEDSDSISIARQKEFRYFNSQQFLEDCNASSINIVSRSNIEQK